MKFNRKIFVLTIFIIFIFMCGAYFAHIHQNNTAIPVISNSTDEFGCCSVVLQLEGNNSIISYRRDSNLTADIFIEKINWHGIPAIKQYKTENGYFNHVIVTNNGWIIGLGGIDDGIDNELCENITAGMISDDNSISKEGLKQIQKIKKPYNKGHVVIKAPNGNYGFANVDKLKTGKLKPGQYISIPNVYSCSRSGNISLNVPDKIEAMNDLARTDLYGVDRREIVTYDFNVTDEGNNTDIYVSNDDGSYFNTNYTDCIDDIYFNNTAVLGKDLPMAPNYKKIGTVTFPAEHTTLENSILLIFIVGFVVFVGILFFCVLRFVRYIRYHIRR